MTLEPTSAPEDAWQPVDPLGEVLHMLRLTGAFTTLSELREPWGLGMPPMPQCLMFHVVTDGGCWLEMEGAGGRRLEPGALALVPHGEGHQLLSAPGEPAVDLFDTDREPLSERYEILRLGGDGATTRMVCGAVRFDHPAARHLVSMLPRVLCIDAWSSTQADWLRSTLRFMAEEARELRPGGETVITRLADVLVIQALRTWIEDAPAARTGWLGALRDSRIGRALVLVHRRPEAPWSVDVLAREIGMSRSAFSAEFRERVGEAPMQYVTRWRMLLAEEWLEEGQLSLAELAQKLGYGSEAAFSRAFKRWAGVSPGAFRRRTATGKVGHGLDSSFG